MRECWKIGLLNFFFGTLSFLNTETVVSKRTIVLSYFLPSIRYLDSQQVDLRIPERMLADNREFTEFLFFVYWVSVKNRNYVVQRIGLVPSFPWNTRHSTFRSLGVLTHEYWPKIERRILEGLLKCCLRIRLYRNFSAKMFYTGNYSKIYLFSKEICTLGMNFFRDATLENLPNRQVVRSNPSISCFFSFYTKDVYCL